MLDRKRLASILARATQGSTDAEKLTALAKAQEMLDANKATWEGIVNPPRPAAVIDNPNLRRYEELFRQVAKETAREFGSGFMDALGVKLPKRRGR